VKINRDQKVREEGKAITVYNARTEVYRKTYSHAGAVIDPTKVSRVALENAAIYRKALLLTY